MVYPVLFANCIEQVGGNNGFYRCGVFREIPRFPPCSDDIIYKKRADLITGKCPEFALFIPHAKPDTIGIGVRGNDNAAVRAGFGYRLHGAIEAFAVFGVGRSDGGEVAVRLHLAFDKEQIIYPAAAQHLRHEPVSRSVQCGVSDPGTVAVLLRYSGRKPAFEYRLHKGFVAFRADDGYNAR